MNSLLHVGLNLLLTLPQPVMPGLLFCCLFHMRNPVRFMLTYVLTLLGIQTVFALYTVWGSGSLFSSLQMLMIPAASILIPCWYSREGKRKTVLFSLLLVALLFSSDLVYSQLVTTFWGERMVRELYIVSIPMASAIKIGYTLFLALLYLPLYLLWKRLVDHSEVGGDMPFLVYLLGQGATVALLDYAFSTIRLKSLAAVLGSILVFAAVLAVSALLLYLFAQAREYYALLARQALLERQLELQEIRGRELANREAHMASLKHELAAQLEQARQYLRCCRMHQAQAAVESAVQQLRAARGVYCAHPVVEAVAAEAARRCRRFGIALDLQLSLPAELPLDGPVLCSLFSNLLDNAIEACQDLDQDARRISCTVVCRKGYLIAEECNPLPPPRTDAAQAERQRDGRGLGLQILQNMAETYQGEISVREQDGCFSITVWLKLLPKEGAAGAWI